MNVQVRFKGKTCIIMGSEQNFQDSSFSTIKAWDQEQSPVETNFHFFTIFSGFVYLNIIFTLPCLSDDLLLLFQMNKA